MPRGVRKSKKKQILLFFEKKYNMEGGKVQQNKGLSQIERDKKKKREYEKIDRCWKKEKDLREILLYRMKYMYIVYRGEKIKRKERS